MRILVVDDDMIARLIIKQNLKMTKGLDAEIVDAENGKEALDAIAENKPDVILLDLNMPIMNGFEVLESLSEQECDIDVYIITSSNLEEDRITCEANSCVKGFFQKPISQGDLDILIN